VVSFLVLMGLLMVESIDQSSEKRINANHGDIGEVCGSEVGVDVHRPDVGRSVSAEVVGDAGWNPYGSQRWHDPS
jgi:hypothetical protein